MSEYFNSTLNGANIENPAKLLKLDPSNTQGATPKSLEDTGSYVFKVDSQKNIALSDAIIAVDAQGGEYPEVINADALGGHPASYFQQQLTSGTNIKTINNQSILGSGNLVIGGGGGSGVWGAITGNIDDQTDLQTALSGKQATLSSGTNIKTINNQSLLGPGNIDIQGGGGGLPTPTEAGVAMVYDGTQWRQQNGYGYFIPGTGANIDWDGQVGTRESFTASFYDEMDGTFVKIYDTPKTHSELKGGSYTFFVLQDVSETLGDNNYVEKEGLIETFSWVPDDAYGYMYSDYELPVFLIFPTSFTHGDQQISPGIYAYNLMNYYYLKNLHWGVQDVNVKIDSKFTFGSGVDKGDARVFNGSEWSTAKNFGYSEDIPQSLVGNVDWNGDTTGLINVGNYYKVSDVTPLGRDLNGTTLYLIEDGDEHEREFSNISDSPNFVGMYAWGYAWVLVIFKPGTYTIYGAELTFSETGLYFLKDLSGGNENRAIKISVPKYTSYHPFNSNYLGYKVASAIDNNGIGYTTPAVSGNITWDGNTEGKTGFEGYYKISDKNVYNAKALIGGTAKYFDGTTTQTVTITGDMISSYSSVGDSIEITDDLEIICMYAKDPNFPIFDTGIYFQKDDEQYVSYLYYSSDGYVSKIASKYIDAGTDNLMTKENPTGTGQLSLNRKASTTIGTNSSTLGTNCTASVFNAYAEGEETTSSGSASHSEGKFTQASGWFSHAQNLGTIAKARSTTAIGEYNIGDGAGSDFRGTYAFIIGNGTSDENRSNALTVDWDGNITTSGRIKATGFTDGTIVKTMSDFLTGDKITAIYGSTGYSEIRTAYNEGKKNIWCGFPDNNQKRLIPLVWSNESMNMFCGSWLDTEISKIKHATAILNTNDRWTSRVDIIQNDLVSGTSIRTINGNTLLGSGDIVINEMPSVTSASSGQVLTANGVGGASWQNLSGTSLHHHYIEVKTLSDNKVYSCNFLSPSTSTSTTFTDVVAILNANGGSCQHTQGLGLGIGVASAGTELSYDGEIVLIPYGTTMNALATMYVYNSSDQSVSFKNKTYTGLTSSTISFLEHRVL